MDEIISIFTESSEDKGIVFQSYQFLNKRINDFLDIVSKHIDEVQKDPVSYQCDISDDINKFKSDINVDYHPEAIAIGDIKGWRNKIKSFRNESNNILKKYSSLRYKMAPGGDLIHGIIFRSKMYSTEINSESYDHINKNIRNIGRALDWVEKILIDLFNMIDQDLNLLTIIDVTYNKNRIYESSDNDLDDMYLFEGYDPPLSYDQLPDHLKDDKVHSWRAKTGIELIHQEPTLGELNRIWVNWNQMNDKQKAMSDQKSIELFGASNEEHYTSLLNLYIPSHKGVEEFYRVLYNGIGVYEAIKQSVSLIIWQSLLRSPKFTWLPKPPSYPEPCRSYFTEEGYMRFCISVLPIIASLGINTNDLVTLISVRLKDVVYSDPYQVVTKMISPVSESGDDTLGIDDNGLDADEKKEEPKPEPTPKPTTKPDSSKNGIRRKKLYIAFIEWAKKYNRRNTFGSIFDKDVFHNSYPFVPDEMRFFYRIANPMLCVLEGKLTFFPVSELRKLNANNHNMNEMLIFAATETELRVFNIKDKKVYKAIEENGNITLQDVLGETFDLYIQKMIGKGDILNAPIETKSDEPPAIE